MYIYVCVCVCVHCTCVYGIYMRNISGPTIYSFGYSKSHMVHIGMVYCYFVNFTTELDLSQMRVKGLEAVCKRSLQLFREGPVVPEAEELQRCIQVASTEERPRRLKCTVL